MSNEDKDAPPRDEHKKEELAPPPPLMGEPVVEAGGEEETEAGGEGADDATAAPEDTDTETAEEPTVAASPWDMPSADDTDEPAPANDPTEPPLAASPFEADTTADADDTAPGDDDEAGEPAPDDVPPAPDDLPEAEEPGEGEPRTVFAPFVEGSAGLPPEGLPPGTGSDHEATAPPPVAAAPPPKGGEARNIRPGDVLNHIFEVTRFIARGGMGEVFEGINVNTDEKVAIKVILPHLAADPQVQAMFRREARTLTRLIHPALVQYRVLAQEPELGVFYIVTEFIEGENLSDVMGRINPKPQELIGLTRRLAEGLAAAHALGAIHRDISPDNVMLEEGKLDQAKIIDFGIAKDLDGATKTIVGDGFAGKLNYVAPEQLGEYGREIGPWTDVYSLALTILALAKRRDVDMGGSLVDAVDKRRVEIDVSDAPVELQATLREMLKANPAERARSMQQVIDLLTGARLAPAPAAEGATIFIPASEMDTARAAKTAPAAGKSGGNGIGAWLKGWRGLALAGVAALFALFGLAYYLIAGSDTESGETAQQAAGPKVASEGAIRQAVMQMLPTIPCSWIDLSALNYGDGQVSLAFRGVLGRGADAGAVQESIAQLVTDSGLKASAIDFSQVRGLNLSDCSLLETFRPIADNGPPRMRAEQEKFEQRTLGAEAGPYAGKQGALAVVEIDLTSYPGDLALLGYENGELVYAGGRAEVSSEQQISPGVFRPSLVNVKTGWAATILLTGTGPFDRTLLQGTPDKRTGDWSSQVRQAAQQGGWKAEMIWYEVVNEVPD